MDAGCRTIPFTEEFLRFEHRQGVGPGSSNWIWTANRAAVSSYQLVAGSP